MPSIKLTQFLYGFIATLFVINIFLLITIFGGRLINYIDKTLLDSYKSDVRRLIKAIKAGRLAVLLPSIDDNPWSRRAFLMVCIAEMPNLSAAEREMLLGVLEKQGIIKGLIAETSSIWLRSRLKACYYLGQLRYAEAVKYLKKLIRNRNYHISQAALFALAKIGRESEVPIDLEKLLGDKRFPLERRADIAAGIVQRSPEKLIVIIKETYNLQIKVAALTALGRLKYEPAFSVFVELLTHPEVEIRIKSAKGITGSNYQLAIPHLIECLENDSEWVMKAASARALGSLKAFDAVNALISALRHPNWWVRTAASDALRAIGEPIIPVVEQQLSVEADRFAADRLAEILFFLKIYASTGGEEHGRMV